MSPAAPDSTGLSSQLPTGEANVGGEEERLDTAAARRQAVATLAQRRSEAASQSALDASSPINSQRRTPKRVHGGNSILKKAWINKNFIDEVCTDSDLCKSAEVRNRHEDLALRDSSHHLIHLRCKKCDEIFHSHCESQYNMHINRSCLGLIADNKTSSKEVSVHEYWHHIVPSIIASTNIPLSVAAFVIGKMEEWRHRLPPNIPIEAMGKGAPRTSEDLENDVDLLARDLWGKIKNSIDDSEFSALLWTAVLINC